MHFFFQTKTIFNSRGLCMGHQARHFILFDFFIGRWNDARYAEAYCGWPGWWTRLTGGKLEHRVWRSPHRTFYRHSFITGLAVIWILYFKDENTDYLIFHGVFSSCIGLIFTSNYRDTFVFLIFLYAKNIIYRCVRDVG